MPSPGLPSNQLCDDLRRVRRSAVTTVQVAAVSNDATKLAAPVFHIATLAASAASKASAAPTAAVAVTATGAHDATSNHVHHCWITLQVQLRQDGG